MKTEILKISSQISLTIEKNFISIKGPQGEKVLKKNKRIHCSFNNSSDILNCRVFFKGGKKEEFLKSDFKSFLSNLKTDIKGCSFAHSDDVSNRLYLRFSWFDVMDVCFLFHHRVAVTTIF